MTKETLLNELETDRRTFRTLADDLERIASSVVMRVLYRRIRRLYAMIQEISKSKCTCRPTGKYDETINGHRSWEDRMMTDKISCPSCGRVKGREATCVHCKCPGETQRIADLNKSK